MLEQIPVNTSIVSITESAAKAVLQLLQKRELSAEDYALRVFVAGGGCSGFQYGMALEGNVRDTDWIVAGHGVRVAVDEVSLDYLRGSIIDYVEDIMGSGFKIENPNAVASCGCGSSFRTKDSGPAESYGGGGCCGCGA